jgi:hypothetical protein
LVEAEQPGLLLAGCGLLLARECAGLLLAGRAVLLV